MDEQKVDLRRYRFDNYKLVTVINPRKEDYKFTVEGNPYEVKAGEKKRLPGYIATVYLNHMAKMVAQDEKKIQFIVDPALLEQYYQKLIIGVDDLVDQAVPNTPEYLQDAPVPKADGNDTFTPEPNGEEDAFDEGDEGDESDEDGDSDKPMSFGFTLNGVSYLAQNGEFTKGGEPIDQEEFEKAHAEVEGVPNE